MASLQIWNNDNRLIVEDQSEDILTLASLFDSYKSIHNISEAHNLYTLKNNDGSINTVSNTLIDNGSGDTFGHYILRG